MDSAVGASFVGVCVSVAGCVPGDRVVSVSTFGWFVTFEGSRMLTFLKSLKNSLSDDPVHRAAATTVEQLEGRVLFYGATVGVNANTTFQTMDGFGASMQR